MSRPPVPCCFWCPSICTWVIHPSIPLPVRILRMRLRRPDQLHHGRQGRALVRLLHQRDDPGVDRQLRVDLWVQERGGGEEGWSINRPVHPGCCLSHQFVPRATLIHKSRRGPSPTYYTPGSPRAPPSALATPFCWAGYGRPCSCHVVSGGRGMNRGERARLRE